MTTLKFSTADVSGADAFDYWQEIARSRVLGLALDIEPEKRGGFDGTFQINATPDATLMITNSSGHLVRRSPTNITRMPSGAVMIYQQLTGSSWFETPGRAPFVTAPGAFAIGDIDSPFASDTVENERHHFRAVALPHALFDRSSARTMALPMQPLANAAGLGALFSVYFDAFCREFDSFTGHAAEFAAQTLAQLAAFANGAAPAGDEVTRLGVRVARLELVRQFIARNLANSKLSAASVAGALGISVRQLHLLFEPTGTTFARQVLTLRLARAKTMLLHDQRSVISIAYACGFESLTTFNRGFRSAFGMSPTEMRRAAMHGW
jgi:AraC-like DNA-binding protein